jgi:hypothetical protein
MSAIGSNWPAEQRILCDQSETGGSDQIVILSTNFGYN